MHKKRLVVRITLGVTTMAIFLLGSRSAFAEVTCGDPDATTGVITCTDSTTGTVTYKNSASATASVTVSSACSFSVARGSGYDQETGAYTATLANGATVPIVGSTFTTTCNDPGGYAIYAVGYSNNTFGNTDLIFDNTPNSSNNIHTNGEGSHWGMSLLAAVENKPNIESGFGDASNPHTIPSIYTKIASYDNITAGSGDTSLVGQAITVTYSATASNTQPAGTYTGAVKYTMVHPGLNSLAYTDKTIADIVYLQDFNSLEPIELASVRDSMAEEQTYTRKDSRDNQDYTIAKLKDGKIWMTKNLNLAGGTELSSETTDFDSSYTLPTTYGWTVNNNRLVLPASSSSGFQNYRYAYVYNSGSTNCSNNSPCYSYYSWNAATLGSGMSVAQENNTDAPYSICPKGWHLPNSRNTVEGNSSDFYQLAVAYGMDPSGITDSTGVFYDNAGPGTAPNFILGGFYDRGAFSEGGNYGRYWSSTFSDTTGISRRFGFNTSSNGVAGGVSQREGLSIRCLVAD